VRTRRLMTAVTAGLAIVAGSGWTVASSAASQANQAGLAGDPVRSTEPVVLTGSQFPDWSAGPELTARAPEPPTDYSVYDDQGMMPKPLQSDCYQSNPPADVNGWTDPSHGDHNCYQSSQLPVRTLAHGVDPASLRGYRWNAKAGKFVQIPFQVDTKWTHYISNNASGFAFYSGIDQEVTYTFDREGFRYTTNAPFDPSNPAGVCQALPVGGIKAAPDPNPGLTNTDEMAFMARDAGGQAPAGTALPKGILDAHQVAIVDPLTGNTGYVYVMRSAPNPPGDPDGPYQVPMAYTAANSPYVRYARDPNADTFVYSQSSYSDYGNAPKGPVCTPDGQPVIGQGFKIDPATNSVVLDPSTYVQRRPLDTATVTTPRYRFRFDGRWLMDSLQVSPDDQGMAKGDYGPSIIDRFKGRAFQQTPGGNTPCCGYEDEQNNWGGSSQLMGEKVGPVRAIRVTWGADSGTNVVRTDIFYADQIDHDYELRVHPIPPLDGIYTQWDMAAGQVTKYYNPYNPNGVPVLGINPETYGNVHAYVGPSGVSYDSADKVGQAVRQANGGNPVSVGNPSPSNCGSTCIDGNFDVPDVTFSGLASEALSWDEFTGPSGTMVEKWGVHQVSPVGTAAAAAAAVPYYRDDACFDDGTGADPGPHLALRSADEPRYWWYSNNDPSTGVPTSGSNPPAGYQLYPRRCWNHNADGSPYNIPGTASYDPNKPAQQSDPPPDPSFSPQGDVRYFQGDIGTHGLHIEFIADADNAQATVPVDEIDSDQHQVVLPPAQGNVGQAYANGIQVPVETLVTAWSAPAAAQSLAGGAGVAAPLARSLAPAGSASSVADAARAPAHTGRSPSATRRAILVGAVVMQGAVLAAATRWGPSAWALAGGPAGWLRRRRRRGR